MITKKKSSYVFYMLHLNLIHHACLEKVHRNLTKNVQLKLTYIILTINFTFNVPFSYLHARNFFLHYI